ncbi:MAG TPA: L,D-transpeptidase [Desulfomonilaceae bacterium]|nr:L,D-transpeptidase [Desulfomonilaceae bacterium]
MISSACVGRLLVFLVVLLVTLGMALGSASAKDPATKDLLLSFVHPTGVQEQYIKEDSLIDKILSVASVDSTIVPRTEDYLRNRRSDTAALLVPRDEEILPGHVAMGSVRGTWPRLASLEPRTPAVARSDSAILDTGDAAASAGRLVADPTGLFSGFDILVDRSKYTLSLYGIRNGEERKPLFTCRVGLGSPDYPTPRGSYYAVRIYDDKPLWIPPPSDWAYGQSPSHSVYGGHMIPLFRKVSAEKGDRNEEIPSELDSVASRAKIVDSGGYRIHGTDSPWSIGSGQSHGCVRMRNESAKGLADALKMYVGTTTRERDPNGTYINLARPVRVILY